MFDAIVKNALVVDGTRAKPYHGDIYIRKGKIAAIGSGQGGEAARYYDAAGHVVAPGFIDIHSHSDLSYLVSPQLESMLVGGVTFEVVGNCGISPVPLCKANRESTLLSQSSAIDVSRIPPQRFPAKDIRSYARCVQRSGVSINMGAMIGHGTLRSYVAGWTMRQMTPDELRKMCTLLDEQLCQGALGLSLGLIYPPGSLCQTGEILALAEVVARRDKLLSVHMRNENRGVFDALEEMVAVARQTGVKLQISHLKLMGRAQWGRAEELLARIDLARAQGARIHCDQYPYTASSSALTSCFPRWALEGGYEQLVQRLQDEAEYARITRDGLAELYHRCAPEDIVISSLPMADWPEILGKSLTQLAAQWGISLPEAIRRVLIRGRGRVQCIYHCMDEDDMLRILARRDVCVCSDGTAYDLSRPFGLQHPRYTGAFARFLRLVRERNLMSVEDAVYKITGLPAAILGLDGRLGAIKPGMEATLTAFDFASIADRATYEQPTLRAQGIDFVLVRGEAVLENGELTCARPGRFFLR